MLPLFVIPSLSVGQEAIPAIPKGEPLPPFTVKYGQIKTILQSNENGVGSAKRTEFTGDVRLLWGDVSLRADRISYDENLGNIEASGNIVLVRGIETIRGSAITFFLQTGTFVVQNGVVVSPPYSIAGERIEQVNGVLRASRAVVAPDVEARGELRLLAREVRFVEGRYTELSDVRFYVYGQRVLTLPRYRILQRYGPRQSDIPQIPLQIKISRISGFAFGLGNTWTLARNATADAQVFFPTKNGPQYLLSANYDLLGTANTPPPFLRRRGRDSIFNAASEKNTKKEIKEPEAAEKEPSPLRRFLTVQPSPGKDPVLDFEPLLGTTESVGRPLQESARFAALSASFSGKEEVGLKRQGNLLLARRPEANFTAALPLNRTNPNGGNVFETNEAARNYLRSPRLALLADVSTGNYRENRLTIAEGDDDTPTTVNANRTGGEVGVNVLPILVGNNILVRSHLSYRQFRYGNGDTYRVPEIGFAASYIVDRRTQIGGAIYRREPTGRTPFFFDQIDTRSEAQGLVQGRVSRRVTAALLVRYDLEQARLFDYGVTVGIRGRSLEPRFGYRKLGGQFSLSFGLIGL
ncbi:MAG: hypothetical protein H8F28_06570 [Fibrella sp.]|nr:hypothetical protein [Armatimonadota bacterium]